MGLALDNRQVGLFVIDTEIALAQREDSLLESFEMLDDLEGFIFSNLEVNTARFPLVKYMSLADMAKELLQYDLIVSF